ncbi:hypothetical protein Tco_0712792 [Tanacetum coccineum]
MKKSRERKRVGGTDIAKITRKRSKPDKHGHEKGKRIQEQGERYQRCQKPGHLAARLGCAETKVATWDDLAFKLIILRWNVKHSTDIAKITRKRSKPDKHGHEKGKRIQEPGERYQRQSVVLTYVKGKIREPMIVKNEGEGLIGASNGLRT